MSIATNLTISPNPIKLKPGKKAEYYIDYFITIEPLNGTSRNVKLYSENTNIVSVNNSTDKITAHAAGQTRIYAEVQDGSGVRGYCDVIVSNPIPVDKINITSSNIYMKTGDWDYIEYTLSPVDTTEDIEWKSSNENVVYVDKYTGVAVAKSEGDATIIASCGGKSDTCKIYVDTDPTKQSQESVKDLTNNDYIADPVSSYSGSHTIKNTLMSLFGGQNLSIIAQYDSNSLDTGTMGKGWYHNFEKHIEGNSDKYFVYESPFTYNKFVPSDRHLTYCCRLNSKRGYSLVAQYSTEYPYALFCNDKRTEYYDTNGRLAKIVDRQGFETQITYSGNITTIKDTVTGKSIYLEKSNGKISRVYDDNNREVILTYTAGCLTQIRDVNENCLNFTYDSDGRVLTGTDAEGICYFTNTYDTDGRVKTQKDGISGSAVTEFTYTAGDYEDDDITNNYDTRTVKNRNGYTSVRKYNEFGQLLEYTDENGNTTTYTYAEDGINIAVETDANGNCVEKGYNTFNKPVFIIDKNGNRTTYEYDIDGNLTRIIYPAINGVAAEEAFTYNSRNQILSHIDLRGTLTEYSYYASGLLKSKKVGSRNAIIYTYENGLLKTETDARGNTTTYGYNALGQMTSKTDPKNHTTSYEYDLSGNLLKTTYANGKSVITTYDKNYQKETVTDANGNTTTYSYNGNLKNRFITLPDENQIEYRYDGEDHPVTMIDQADNITTMVYDKGGRVIEKHLPDNSVFKYAYDAVGNLTRETNPNNIVKNTVYDPMGNIHVVYENQNNINDYTRYYYDAMNRLVQKIDSASGSTSYTYSPAGDLLSESDALGNTKRYTYDEYGNRLSFTDARNNTTSYTYDANNNLLTVTDPLNRVTKYAYNSLNQLISVADGKGRTVTYGYDEMGRRTTVTDARGNTFTTEYDDNGNVTKVIDAKGNTISQTTYNNLNLPHIVTEATGKVTTNIYNELGKIYTVTDNLSNSQEYLYDTRGRNYSVKDALNNASTVVYDAVGNITQLSGPLGGSTNYTYNTVNQLLSESTPSGGMIQYTYNDNSLMNSITNARGQEKNLSYDYTGKLSYCETPTHNVEYTYDANGNILNTTKICLNNETIEREYDALNRVTKYTDTLGNVIQYQYDLDGNPLKITAQPENATALNGTDATVTLTATGDGLKYKWYYKDAESTDFVCDDTFTANTYTAQMSEEISGRQVYCIITDIYDNCLQSNTATILSGTVVSITEQPTDVTVSSGENAVVSFEAIGDDLTYSWYYKNSGSEEFSYTSTFTGNSYNVTMNSTRAGRQIYCIVTDKYGNSVQTNTVTLGMGNSVKITAQPTSATVASGSTARVSFTATGDGLTYDWYYKNADSEEFLHTSSYTSNTYTVTMNNARHGRQIYCVVSDQYGNRAQTDTVSLNITGGVKITVQPQSVTVPDGNHANITFTATGDGLTYNWYYKNKGAEEFVYTPTFTTKTYSAEMNSSRDGRQIYCIVTDQYGNSAKTDTVTLNMAQTLEIIRQPETKLVADGMKVSFDFEAKGDGLTYKWYSKNKAANTFSYTDSFDSNTYTTVMSDSRAGRQVYCVVTDMHGNSVQTDTVILRKKYYDKIIYPDNTAVIYAYDENNNIISVSDWAGRITRYTYDENNNIIGIIKPDGSVTTTVYNNAQQVVSTTECSSSGMVIVGYEYTYDTLGRVTEEIHLAENTKLCYTYDNLSRVTNRTMVNTATNETISQETFTYDAAGNITGDNTETTFVYDTNNRLTSVGGQAVTYDLDGNMLSCGTTEFTYDSENRLLSAGNNTYAYNAENIRIRNLCGESETTYAYNTNARLSQLLVKTTDNVATKYVYGVGLIGEETGGVFKTYHFDMRGSTTAITDMSGNVTDTFKYDTYGKLISRTGSSDIIFLYNGRDGVITEQNGLLYMRTRYYSPVLRRFINADILHGSISDSTSLNRYAYVNGNPVSFVDPTGYIGITALILIGAGIGAVVGGVSSVVSQKAESDAKGEEFDLDVVELFFDTFWGAVDGAISFSPLGPTGKVIGGAVVSVGNSITDEFVDDEEGFNYLRAGGTAAVDFALSEIELDFLGGANIGKTLKNTNSNIARLNRRKNKKWASKQIARQTKDFNDLLSLKINEEVFYGFMGISKNLLGAKVQVRAK